MDEHKKMSALEAYRFVLEAADMTQDGYLRDLPDTTAQGWAEYATNQFLENICAALGLSANLVLARVVNERHRAAHSRTRGHKR